MRNPDPSIILAKGWDGKSRMRGIIEDPRSDGPYGVFGDPDGPWLVFGPKGLAVETWQPEIVFTLNGHEEER